MINENGKTIIPFSNDMIEYLKKVMKKEDTWHKFDCSILKRGDVLYLSESCLVTDPLHEQQLNPASMKEFVVMKEKKYMNTDERIKEISGMKTICGFISDSDASFLLALVKVQREALNKIADMEGVETMDDHKFAEATLNIIGDVLSWQQEYV